MNNENLRGLANDCEYEPASLDKDSHLLQMKIPKMSLPEYKAFHNIPDESPESSFVKSSAPHLSTPSPKPTKTNALTVSENVFKRRYRHRTPSTSTHHSGTKLFLFSTLNPNPSTPKTETLELSSKRSTITRDTIDSGVVSFTSSASREKELEVRIKNLTEENKILKDKISNLSINLLEARKPLGYDEFYVKTLVQQKDYFEKELKSSYEILNNKEIEYKSTISQLETMVSTLLDERNEWKEKACEFEKMLLEKTFSNCTNCDELKRALGLRDKELEELKQDLQEKENIAHTKLTAAAMEIERLKEILEREDKNWQIQPETQQLNSSHELRGAEMIHYKQLDLSRMTDSGKYCEESTDFETFRRLDDEKFLVSHKSSLNFGNDQNESRKIDLHHIMLMIEIDRLHSIIDELARLIELSSPNYIICRE